MTIKTPFDPWDWLGVHCGGWFDNLDIYILAFLEELRDGEPDAIERREPAYNHLFQLVATLLCNTDAFEFDGDPTQLRFVGDEQFKTLDALIDAWDQWYGEHYR